jgi:acetyl esterase/lipase
MMLRMRHVIALLAASSLSGCAAISWLGHAFGGQVLPILNGATGTRSADVSHFAYGPHKRHQLDVYRPKGVAGPLPVALFFYGGYWDSGDRANYAFVGEGLAARGIAVVIPDYRIYPEIGFPTFVEDGALATRWTFDHLAVVGGDRGRVTVMGHSAGAHIASLLALDERYLRARGFVTPPFAGFVGLAGPYDFNPVHLPFTPAKTRAIFGTEAAWGKAKPITYLEGGEPPMLLFHGTTDKVCWPFHTEKLAAKARGLGIRADAPRLPGGVHKQRLVGLAPPLRALAPVLEPAARFIQAPRAAE